MILDSTLDDKKWGADPLFNSADYICGHRGFAGSVLGGRY
jgi:hypothetical protein